MDDSQQKGIITRIEQQKKKRNRYNIYIDGEYSFSVHEDVLVSSRLLKDKEVDLAFIQKVLEDEEKNKIKRTALHFLSYRPRTRKEIEDHLLKKEYEQKHIVEILNQFEKEKLIDDQSYAIQWCRERSELKKKSKLVLREELRQKGVALNWIEQAIELIPEELERNSCLEVAQKKAKSLGDIHLYDKKVKLYQYLSRKGYALELIQEVYQELLESEES